MLTQLRTGATWTYMAMAIGGVLQLAATAVTSRLLDPTAFGLVAMANIVVRFGNYFAQMGIGRALIQAETIDEHDIRATLTSSLLFGASVALLAVLLAPLVASYFQAPEVVPVIRWLSLTFVLGGMSLTSQALLRRRLRFRALGAIEVVSFGLGYAVPAVLLAMSGFGVWSLVGGMVGQAAIAAVLGYVLTRHPVLPTLKFSVYRRLLRFGAVVSGISLLEYFGQTLDSLVIGRFGTPAQLGIYNRGHLLASLPTYSLNEGLAKVLFPVLSRGRSNPEEFKTSLLRVALLGVRVVVPLGVGLAVAAPEIVQVVLGDQWSGSASVLAILGASMAIGINATFPGLALEALGVLRGKFVVQASYVLVLGAALFFVASRESHSLTSIAAAVASALVLRVLAYYLLALRAGAITLRSVVSVFVTMLISAAVTAALMFPGLAVMRGLDAPTLVRLLVAIGLGVISLAGLNWRDARQLLGLLRTPRATS